MITEVMLRAKCTHCGRVYDMTPQLRAEAREFGCAMSPCCMVVAIVDRVTVKREARKRQRR